MAIRRLRAHDFSCRLVWTGAGLGATTSYASFSRDHRLLFDGKPSIDGSAAAAFRGDGSRHNPEELLLAALCSCHFLSYAAQCAAHGVSLLEYEDDATLQLAPVDGLLRVTGATLSPRVKVASQEQLAPALALHRAAHAGCFIARSVAFSVALQPAASVAG